MKIILITLSFYSCGHNIPIANIQFTKIEKDSNYENSFFLYFSSDVELINNLQKEHLGGRIDCFFKNKQVNKNDYANYKGYLLSSVGDLRLVSKDTKYEYKIETFFKLEEGDNISKNIQDENRDALKGALKNISNKEFNCISCVVTAVTFMNTTSRYISNTMCLPKVEIKKIMNK